VTDQKLCTCRPIDGVNVRGSSCPIHGLTPDPGWHPNDSADMSGKRCDRCGRGKYKETSIHDDMEGVLHCSDCGVATKRWRAKKA